MSFFKSLFSTKILYKLLLESSLCIRFEKYESMKIVQNIKLNPIPQLHKSPVLDESLSSPIKTKKLGPRFFTCFFFIDPTWTQV